MKVCQYFLIRLPLTVCRRCNTFCYCFHSLAWCRILSRIGTGRSITPPSYFNTWWVCVLNFTSTASPVHLAWFADSGWDTCSAGCILWLYKLSVWGIQWTGSIWSHLHAHTHTHKYTNYEDLSEKSSGRLTAGHSIQTSSITSSMCHFLSTLICLNLGFFAFYIFSIFKTHHIRKYGLTVWLCMICYSNDRQKKKPVEIFGEFF